MDSDLMFAAVETVAAVSGHSKMAFLDIEMKPYLLAAYDPYIRYYLKRPEKPPFIGKGKNIFDQETWSILDDLSARRLSGNLANDIVNAHLKQLTPASSRLFIRILNKDLRWGLGAKSINKALSKLIPTHDIMLAKLFQINRVKYPCFGSPKIDGVRALLKRGEFYSRSGKIYKGLERLKAEIRDAFGVNSILDVPVLDGELTVIGTTFQTGSGMIRRDEETPDAHFSLFELPEVTAPFTHRVMMMDDLTGTSSYMSPVHHEQLLNEDQLMGFFWGCRNLGYEGSVIKPMNYQYKGSRSYDWMKMKQVLTVDLEVEDVEEGTGKYENCLGKAVVNYKGKPVRVGTGFTDDERDNFWLHPEVLIGKTIEIEYMEETDDGSLRHPRFIGIRFDK